MSSCRATNAKAVAEHHAAYPALVRALLATVSQSTDVEDRQLQTAHSERLVLLGTVPGTREDEARVHGAFAFAKARGEWFRPDPLLLRFVTEVTGT